MVRVTVTTDPILDARLPAGARFYKCALQVNPHDYGGTFRGQKSDGDAISHAHAIVDKAVAVGIEVLAVTNHNSVTALAAFRSAARKRGVRIFPGFELSSSEGVHVLRNLSTTLRHWRLRFTEQSLLLWM